MPTNWKPPGGIYTEIDVQHIQHNQHIHYIQYIQYSTYWKLQEGIYTEIDVRGSTSLYCEGGEDCCLAARWAKNNISHQAKKNRSTKTISKGLEAESARRGKETAQEIQIAVELWYLEGIVWHVDFLCFIYYYMLIFYVLYYLILCSLARFNYNAYRQQSQCRASIKTNNLIIFPQGLWKQQLSQRIFKVWWQLGAWWRLLYQVAKILMRFKTF